MEEHSRIPCNCHRDHSEEAVEKFGATPYSIAVTDDTGRRYDGFPCCMEIDGNLTIVDSYEDLLCKEGTM